MLLQLWDLTAGKLMHEFKCHEGQIQCIDFHPHEFLLATGWRIVFGLMLHNFVSSCIDFFQPVENHCYFLQSSSVLVLTIDD